MVTTGTPGPTLNSLMLFWGDRPSTRPQHVIDTTEPPPEEEIGANDGEDSDEEGGDEQDSRTESGSMSSTTTPAVSNLSSLNMDMGELDDPEDGYIEEGGSRNDDTEPDVHERQSNTTGPSGLGQRRHREPTVRAPSSKRAKKTGIERALASFTDTFLEHQRKMEARLMATEERRRREDMKLMEKMRKDDRDHEFRIFQVLGQMMSSTSVHSPYHMPLAHPLEPVPPSPYPTVNMYPVATSSVPPPPLSAPPQSERPTFYEQ